jgi:hypothetical protein
VSIRCYHRISTSFQPTPAPLNLAVPPSFGETPCQGIYSGREEPFLSAQQDVIFRLPEPCAARIGCANRAQADTEDYRSQKIYWRFLRKRSNPSRNAVPEFSPVAGASFCTFYLMPDERRKTQDKTSGLSHNVSRRTYLYTTPSGLAQGPASDLLTSLVPEAEAQLSPNTQHRDTALMVSASAEAMRWGSRRHSAAALGRKEAAQPFSRFFEPWQMNLPPGRIGSSRALAIGRLHDSPSDPRGYRHSRHRPDRLP